MDRNQKRIAAIFLCIAGIIGTLMAGKDAAAKRQETAGTGTEVTAEAPEQP